MKTGLTIAKRLDSMVHSTTNIEALQFAADVCDANRPAGHPKLDIHEMLDAAIAVMKVSIVTAGSPFEQRARTYPDSHWTVAADGSFIWDSNDLLIWRLHFDKEGVYLGQTQADASAGGPMYTPADYTTGEPCVSGMPVEAMSTELMETVKVEYSKQMAECYSGCTDPDCPYTHPIDRVDSDSEGYAWNESATLDMKKDVLTLHVMPAVSIKAVGVAREMLSGENGIDDDCEGYA